MANETATPTQGNAPAANPAVPASASPATPQGGKGKSKKKSQMVTFTDRKGRQMTMPENSFQARLNREAAALVRTRLGVPIEEAERIVKEGGASSSRSAQATADESLMRENAKLKREVDQRKREVEFTKKKASKDVQRLKDRQIDAELRFAAMAAGITDPDYAVELFARAARDGKEKDPAKFFGSLKTSRPYLFEKTATPPEAAPAEVPATTAPAESAQPGEVKPTPAPAGTPTGGVKVEEMSPQEFTQYTRSQYGFSPGS